MSSQENKNPLLTYIQNHPLLNLSGIAREVGMDPSNFKKKVANGSGKLKPEVEEKLEKVLREYGFGGVEWVKVEELELGVMDVCLGMNVESGEMGVGSVLWRTEHPTPQIASTSKKLIPTHTISLTKLLNLPKKD